MLLTPKTEKRLKGALAWLEIVACLVENRSDSAVTRARLEPLKCAGRDRTKRNKPQSSVVPPRD